MPTCSLRSCMASSISTGDLISSLMCRSPLRCLTARIAVAICECWSVIVLSTTPIVSSPLSWWRSAPSPARNSSTESSSRSVAWYRELPSTVSRNPRRPRSHNLMPTRDSRSAMCVLMVERFMLSADSAAESPPQSVTVLKMRSKRRSKSVILIMTMGSSDVLGRRINAPAVRWLCGLCACAALM